jgi:hypothetical protein
MRPRSPRTVRAPTPSRARAAAAVGVALGLFLGARGARAEGPPAAAPAADPKVVKKVEELNRAAMEDYDLLEFESAKKGLGDALVLVKRAKLDKSAIAARTHLNLGIVYGGGLQDADTAILEFMSAVEIDSGIKLPAAYRTPALQKLLDQARASVAAGGKSGPGSAPATPRSGDSPGPRGPPPPSQPAPPRAPPPSPASPPPSDTAGFRHTPVEDAGRGRPIPVAAQLGSGLPAATAMLFYRPAGAEAFVSLPMADVAGPPGKVQATIPAPATAGAQVHYFIEVRTPDGTLVASSGSPEAPNIIVISRAAPGGAGGDEGADEENPLAAAGRPARRGGGATVTEAAGAQPPARRHVRFGVSFGSGAGLVNGETEVSHEPVTCCVALAPFHIMPELGIWLGPDVALSIYGRIGIPIGANVNGAASVAPAGFLRLSYYPDRSRAGAGPYVHGDLGGGFIRHVIKLRSSGSLALGGDTDTFATGPLFVGAGTGWAVPLGGALRLVLDLNLEAGIPIVSDFGDTKLGFAVNADLSLGLAVSL